MALQGPGVAQPWVPASAPGRAEGGPGPPHALRKTRRPMEGMADPWAHDLPADPIMPAMATTSAIFLPRRSASCIEGRAAPARPCRPGPGAKARRTTPLCSILYYVPVSRCSDVAQAPHGGRPGICSARNPPCWNPGRVRPRAPTNLELAWFDPRLLKHPRRFRPSQSFSQKACVVKLMQSV